MGMKVEGAVEGIEGLVEVGSWVFGVGMVGACHTDG